MNGAESARSPVVIRSLPLNAAIRPPAVRSAVCLFAARHDLRRLPSRAACPRNNICLKRETASSALAGATRGGPQIVLRSGGDSTASDRMSRMDYEERRYLRLWRAS